MGNMKSAAERLAQQRLKIHVWLSHELHGKLKERSRVTARSMSSLINEAVEKLLADAEQERVSERWEQHQYPR